MYARTEHDDERSERGEGITDTLLYRPVLRCTVYATFFLTECGIVIPVWRERGFHMLVRRSFSSEERFFFSFQHS